jgi:hypothetical protein
VATYITYREGRKVIKEKVTTEEQFDKLADREAKGEIFVREISATKKLNKN